MNSKEIELDDYPDEVFASEEAFLKRFRPLEGDKLIEHKRRIAKARASGAKSRVTIYLDRDIISLFKEKAEKEEIGYQTLINDVLRQIVDNGTKEKEKQTFKEDLLVDKKFLRKLKTALSA